MGAKSSKVAPDNVTSVDAVRIIHVLPAASPIDELQSSRTASSVWEQSITYLEEEEEEEELDPRDDVASSQSYLDSDSESCFEQEHDGQTAKRRFWFLRKLLGSKSRATPLNRSPKKRLSFLQRMFGKRNRVVPMATTRSIIESPGLLSMESAGQDSNAESMLENPEGTETISATHLLSQTCSQVPAANIFPGLQLELENMRARMEVSFREILRVVGLPYSPSDVSSTDNRQSDGAGAIEDSLSLIIDDIVLGRHTL